MVIHCKMYNLTSLLFMDIGSRVVFSTTNNCSMNKSLHRYLCMCASTLYIFRGTCLGEELLYLSFWGIWPNCLLESTNQWTLPGMRMPVTLNQIYHKNCDICQAPKWKWLLFVVLVGISLITRRFGIFSRIWGNRFVNKHNTKFL